MRESIIIQRDGAELLFIFSANRIVKRFRVNDVAMRALPLLDGTRTVEDVASALGDFTADIAADLRVLLGLLEEEKILSRVSDLSAAASTLGAEAAGFYDRQLRIFQDFCDERLTDSDEGAALQQRLSEATVVIFGLGGVGGWVAHSLAATGVGTLRVCDFDTVEPSNLTRQVLFAATDVGRLKAEAAADRMRAVNPYIRVQPFSRKINDAADLADIVAGAGLVINAADQPSPNETSASVALACWPDIPHIMGAGYAYHIGMLGTTILPGRTACWDCVRAQTLTDHGRDRAETLIGRRGQAGALGPLTGLVASILAWECIRVLTGLPPVLANQWAEFDYWPLQIRTRPIESRPLCTNCGGKAS